MEQLQLDASAQVLVEALCSAQGDGERARVLVSGIASRPWVEACALWHRPRPGGAWSCLVSRGPAVRLPDAGLVVDLAEGRLSPNLVSGFGVVTVQGAPRAFALAHAGQPPSEQELDALGALVQLFGLLSCGASSDGELHAPLLPAREEGPLGELDSSLAQTLRRWLQRSARPTLSRTPEITLSVHPEAEELECLLRSAELEQVLELLVENACAAQETWSTRAWVRLSLQQLSCTDELCLCIDDGGPGLPPEIAAALRTQDPAQIPGDGLGLALSLGIVNSVGGRIEPGANPEGGARLVLFLPRVPPA